MAERFEEWSVSKQLQPKPEDFPFDVDWTLSSTVSLRAVVPPDAFTAQILGTLRTGQGAVIAKVTAPRATKATTFSRIANVTA